MVTHPEATYFDDEWEYMEGIEDLGFAAHPQRQFPDSKDPVFKTSGIKGRRGNPTLNQISYTNGLGFAIQATDQLWTIWASTFQDGGYRYMPKQGDILSVLEMDASGTAVTPLNVLERWLVQWSKLTMYDSQYLCYCTQSPLNEDVLS